MTTATLDHPQTFQWSRSSAIGVAIAVHAFAALLLLAPPAMEQIQHELRRDEPIFVMPEVKPPEVKPVEPLKPIKFEPKRQPVVKQTTPPVPTPVTDEYSPMAHPVQPVAPPTDIGDPQPPVADTAPSALSYAKMTTVPYPATSARRKEQGRVMLRVLVGSNGVPEKVEIESSSGFIALDRAARDAVAKWRFTPGTRNGVAFAAWGLVPIEFKLNEL